MWENQISSEFNVSVRSQIAKQPNLAVPAVCGGAVSENAITLL
jgi:hypothetical protein